MAEHESSLEKNIKKLYLEKYGSLSGDEIMIYQLERLDKGTNKLNCLTIALITITAILAILTSVQIWLLVCQP